MALNDVDVCFVVDTTGSMGPFIEEAKRHLLELMDSLRAACDLRLQVGLVEYRDHPPEDASFVTRTAPLTEDLRRAQRAISRMKAEGGGDEPEAVYDGVQAACTEMRWRAHSWRFLLLVGDAPPHGFGAQAAAGPPAGRARRPTFGDHWAEGCPCGLTAHSVAAAAETARATLHALCLGGAPATLASFTEIAIGTGGSAVPATDTGQVVRAMVEMLESQLRHLELDGRVLEGARALGSLDTIALSERLCCSPLQAASSIARLGKRGFFEG